MRALRLRIHWSLATALVLLLPAAARAQTCTAPSPGTCSVNTTASMVIPPVIQLALSPGPGPQPATLADFTAGYGQFGGPTATVSANTPWSLSISAVSAFWSATNTVPGVLARTNKPAADLAWSTNAATFTPLSVTAQQMATGGRTNAAVSNLTWRVMYSLTLDTPGDYSMTVQFTLTAP